MSKRKLRTFGTLIALAGLLALQLHALAHVLGHDDDHTGKAAPCALCRTVLAQHSLAPAASIEAPGITGFFSAPRPALAPLCVRFFSPRLASRGPPTPLGA